MELLCNIRIMYGLYLQRPSIREVLNEGSGKQSKNVCHLQSESDVVASFWNWEVLFL